MYEPWRPHIRAMMIKIRVIRGLDIVNGKSSFTSPMPESNMSIKSYLEMPSSIIIMTA